MDRGYLNGIEVGVEARFVSDTGNLISGYFTVADREAEAMNRVHHSGGEIEYRGPVWRGAIRLEVVVPVRIDEYMAQPSQTHACAGFFESVGKPLSLDRA